MNRRDDVADVDDDSLPDGVDPIGVPGRRSGRDAFWLSAALVGALLGLAFTLSWIVYRQLVPAGDSPQTPPSPTGETVVSPIEPAPPS